MAHIEEIKTAIVEREEEIKQKFEMERIIERDKTDKVKKLLSTDVALIITGARRCGKSIFAFMLGRDEKFGYVNFEDERLSIEGRELNRVLEAIYALKGDVNLLIFDEIQNVEGWEKFVSRLLPTKKVIITGSNARLLSKELATFLTGRHVDSTLFPFSFREFLRFNEFEPNIYLTKDIARIKEYLRDYLENGGFPLVYKIGRVFLMENYKDIIERDIIQRYKIRYPRVLKNLARYMITNSSREISFNKLKNILKVKSVHTIINYSSYLENAYLLIFLERFSFKLKEQVKAPKKVYCIDTGLINSIGFKFSENLGRLVENLVAIELKRMGHEIYYWKDYQRREVDFVIKDGLKVKELIQVCYDIEDFTTKERELKALVKAGKELKCKNLKVITWDYDGREEFKGKEIRFIPLWRWLLNKNLNFCSL